MNRAAEAGGGLQGGLPMVYGFATNGGRDCYKGLTWLLQGAVPFATRGCRTCYNLVVALLPIHGAVAANGRRRCYRSTSGCYQGATALLPPAAGVATNSRRAASLLQWRGGVAAGAASKVHHMLPCTICVAAATATPCREFRRRPWPMEAEGKVDAAAASVMASRALR
jgi:hypothetical protein